MNILTVNANQANGKITINGTAEPGMLAVAIDVYDKSGTTRIANRSTSVNNDGSFSYELEIAEAEYQICVADFNGGDCKTVTVTVATEEETATDTNTAGTPETGYQTIVKNTETVEPATNASANMFYPILVLGVLSITVITVLARRAYLRRNKK